MYILHSLFTSIKTTNIPGYKFFFFFFFFFYHKEMQIGKALKEKMVRKMNSPIAIKLHIIFLTIGSINPEYWSSLGSNLIRGGKWWGVEANGTYPFWNALITASRFFTVNFHFLQYPSLSAELSTVSSPFT